MGRESLEVSLQALDQSKREPLKEANNWSSELSMSSNVLAHSDASPQTTPMYPSI